MALSSTPSLTEINTELNVTGESLVQCINIVGKTGVWTKQSDFANYSHTVIVSSVNDVTLPYDAGAGQFLTEITSQSAWSVVAGENSWLTASPNTGSIGTTAVFSITTTNTGSQRQSTLIFSDVGGSTDHCTVTQLAQPAPPAHTLHTSPNSRSLTGTDTVAYVTLSLTYETDAWEMYEISQVGTWINSVTPSSATGSRSITVSIDTLGIGSREGFVNFRLVAYPSETATFRIAQFA